MQLKLLIGVENEWKSTTGEKFFFDKRHFFGAGHCDYYRPLHRPFSLIFSNQTSVIN